MLFSCTSKNTLTLRFDNNVNKKDVRISLEIPPYLPLTQIYDGEKQFEIPNEYGTNDWYFTYKNLKGYRQHFKTNRRNKHNYTFVFKELNGKYFVDMDIKGVNDIKRTVELR
jgi:hypothetical protein